MPERVSPAEARRLLAKASGQQPESVVLRQVRDYLRALGWFVIRHQQGLGSHRGLSDLTAIRGGRTIWLEAKTATGRQSEYQRAFQEAVEAHGGEYRVVRGIEDVADLAREES